MQTLKKEQLPSGKPCLDGQKVVLLAPDFQDVSETQDENLFTPELSSSKSKNANCRRKREFIPDEKKDAVYWEKRRKNNEAAKRSREKRRLNDMVLENKLVALGEENTTLKTELLSLKLKFGLISSTAYAQEVQKLSNASALYFQDFPASCTNINSFSLDPDQSAVGNSCISVIKHSPRSSLSDASDVSSNSAESPFQANCSTVENNFKFIKEEPIEIINYAKGSQEDTSHFVAGVFKNYIGNSFSTFTHSPPTLQMNRSSSNSPRTSETDDCVVGKTSDAEDEQQVPKGPIHSPAEVKNIHANIKVPEGNSALPHKLRIKANAIKIKTESIDHDPDLSDKPALPIDMSAKRHQLENCSKRNHVHHSVTPLSVQVTNIHAWTNEMSQWHQKDLDEKVQSSYSSKAVIRDNICNTSEAENLYLKQGIANLSAEVASLKRLISKHQMSCFDANKNTTEKDLQIVECDLK
ncbi:nuclear factor interleukin-3-regulated protein [Protopterus annectens]|uniref:nuclear factor interleukin-3-regulated protein n=1 Tax=Protopterus annectens TaxID=7888 RepID=UPI001CFA61FE|nr:nuclear factor interleukin-3-regulated protein [Protopterus annectens]XP_043943959.1 nuclear factor interleukin-3-regulated protein [Protopterus annectens]XP_043943960.1 nuclear factor interleukin-3-regulated protein [Protopterus annectens]XP_043943961.1 nuclear factor interleukin-3-regulated protein [Protopterus annectens]XP_043943962.1 nuclear factor interleukin-3-regulated protein [Protopterus annectens]XP_043943963.1 nuclear factor interleukin-3-regulated protein [Protopterus annectens]